MVRASMRARTGPSWYSRMGWWPSRRCGVAVSPVLKSKEIGQLGGGKRKLTGSLDVAMIQSLVRRDEVHEVVGQYGHVLVDECHG